VEIFHFYVNLDCLQQNKKIYNGKLRFCYELLGSQDCREK